MKTRQTGSSWSAGAPREDPASARSCHSDFYLQFTKYRRRSPLVRHSKAPPPTPPNSSPSPPHLSLWFPGFSLSCASRDATIRSESELFFFFPPSPPPPTSCFHLLCRTGEFPLWATSAAASLWLHDPSTPTPVCVSSGLRGSCAFAGRTAAEWEAGLRMAAEKKRNPKPSRAPCAFGRKETKRGGQSGKF